MISFKSTVILAVVFFFGYLFMFGTLPEIMETIVFYIENTSISDLLLSNTAVIGIGLSIFLVALLFVGHQGEKRYW
ncbi:MAG: hypothetical protein ACW99Q_07850 [Candidatus Kariarchaeaceae archaeon]|jgi:hypothetical protein